MAKKNTSIMRYDEELARQAEEYANQEANTGGGEFFGTAGGVLKFNDQALPDNQVGCVILDSIIVNAKYEGKYDRDNPQSPACYAFGRDEKTMTPHAESPDAQCDTCDDCPHNVFGSGEGRGKACKNTRRLALLPAGTYDGNKFKPFTKAEQFEKGKFGYLSIPPTSLNAFGAFVKQIAGTLKRPPHGIFAKVKLIPEDGGFSFSFEPISKIPDELLPVVMSRHKEAREVIAFPWPKAEVEAKPKRSAKPAAKRGKKKY